MRGLPVNVLPDFSSTLTSLIQTMQAQTQANLELAAAIRLQANAIADLAESNMHPVEPDDEPQSFRHLGML